MAIAVSIATFALAACSSGASSDSSSTEPDDVLTSTSLDATESASPPPSASVQLAVGLDLATTWATPTLAETGEGYGMRLDATSDPDLFDGHYFRRESDGAVTDQLVITIAVTSPANIEVTWPDGSARPGVLRLAEDGATVTEIDLNPGCIAYLADGGTDADCVLMPESNALVPSSASPTALPSQDEAMSYLCSVDVDELSNVVGSASDPHSTSVLQAALTVLGYDPGPIDGSYGSSSKDAVRRFQADSALTVDAQVGPRTWTSLQAAACHLPEDPAQPAD
jgi:hypothetical protein